MISSRRTLAFGIVLSLLLVPALARANQSLDLGKRPSAAAKFTKSFDIPPDFVVVAPDRAVTAVDVDALQHPAASTPAVHPETLPNDPELLDADALRGPPAAPRP
jgi:hypothetical protein